MIVVDTNLIAYLLVPGEFSQDAEAVLKKDPEWQAPLLWRSEFRNVLARYVRLQQLTLDMALAIVENAEALMQGSEHQVNSPDVLRLASASGRQAYDCEFIALAEDLDLILVTSDGRLTKSFPSRARLPRDYLRLRV